MREKTCNDLTAAEVMSDVVLAIPGGMSVRAAARLMAEAGTSVVPVTDARGRCVGLLFASDALRLDGDEQWAGPDACFWSEWQMDAAAPPGAARGAPPAGAAR